MVLRDYGNEAITDPGRLIAPVPPSDDPTETPETSADAQPEAGNG